MRGEVVFLLDLQSNFTILLVILLNSLYKLYYQYVTDDTPCYDTLTNMTVTLKQKPTHFDWLIVLVNSQTN